MSPCPELNDDEITRRRRSARLVLLAILAVGSLPIVAPISCVMVGMTQASVTRLKLREGIDHQLVRDTARQAMQEKKYKMGRWIHPWELPQPLRDLEPVGANVDKRGLLRLEFGGGFHHQGLLVAPEGQGVTGQDIPTTQRIEQLANGLWFYEDGK